MRNPRVARQSPGLFRTNNLRFPWSEGDIRGGEKGLGMSQYCGRAGRAVRRLLGVLAIMAAAQSAWAVEPKVVSFRAADGLRIAADYYPPPAAEHAPAPMALLLHMYKSDRSAWRPLIPALHDAGFAVLAIDMRGHGGSATTGTRQQVDERDTQVFRDMQHDVRGAYDWLVKQDTVDRARFVIVGASVGCSVALQYAVDDRSVDAIVCLSPGTNYLGLDSAGDIHQITGRRILLLATEDERDGPYTLKKRGSDVEVDIFARKSAHGTRMFGVIPGLEERIASYVRTAVGKPSKSLVYGTINSNIYHRAGSGWIEKITPTNLRVYSSVREAESRGLRGSRSQGPAAGSEDDRQP